jgi:hypothetical protein
MQIRQNDRLGKFAYVVHDEICVGFLIARRKAIEAFDQNEHSLGTFSDDHTAVAAIFKSAGAL